MGSQTVVNKLLKYLFIATYSAVSVVIFNRVYGTSTEVIDELFHIDQGRHYCEGYFEAWDSKITTFPGLYLLSSFIPPEYCDTYTLRLIPLICSILNVVLIYEIKSLILYYDNEKSSYNVLLETVTLATLPPMFFFAHVYYTDIPSISMILLMLLFSLKRCHKTSSLFGAASVLMRQTNIVWVAGTLGVHLVDKMMLKVYPKMKRESATFKNFMFALKSHLKYPKILMGFIGGSIRDFYGYIFIILGFIAFLVINGSIVVGDKTAHEATLHVPQLFYFSIFVLVFGSSLWIPQLLNSHKIFRSWKCLLGIIMLGGLIAVAVHFNTVIHPYLLADNRHYTFYVFNRFYLRYDQARFAIIPAYIFGLSTIFSSLDGSIGFKMFFIVSTVLTLCLQSMIEVRYFLIPFLLLRLNRNKVTKKWTIVELLVNLAINYATFTIFFNTKVRWENFEEDQRIIW